MKPSFEKNSLVTNPPRVGVASLILRGGRVLLVQRKHSHGAGSWSTPGGHLEHGETPEACAIRETREEVGLEVTAVRFLAVTNDIFDTEGKHYITIWMEAVCERGEPRIAAEDEVAALGWFAWDALPAPLFIPFENLLHCRSYPADAIERVKRSPQQP